MVVYRPFPTSNHNCKGERYWAVGLYIVRFLHQTTTARTHQNTLSRCISSVSYIKPQPATTTHCASHSCISSVSYIKPQHIIVVLLQQVVVYRPFPTSNHNCCVSLPSPMNVVYRPFPTSNHNLCAKH